MAEIKFRLAEQSVHPDTPIVEILWDGKCCAAIYPAREGDGIRVISAHLLNSPDGVYFDTENDQIPAVTLRFKPGKYAIVDGKIVRMGDE